MENSKKISDNIPSFYDNDFKSNEKKNSLNIRTIFIL